VGWLQDGGKGFLLLGREAPKKVGEGGGFLAGLGNVQFLKGEKFIKAKVGGGFLASEDIPRGSPVSLGA
jgi:hypothetical protein